MSRIRGAMSLDAVLVALIVVAAAAFSGAWTLRAREWGFMTDEMLYVKIALHMGGSLSPVPTVRGEHLSEFKLLYPALIAPLFALFSMPVGFVIAHGLNSVAMAVSAVPAYLIAREVGLSRLSRLIVAAMTAVLPWTVMSMFLMTESLAYPLFLLAVWTMIRAVAAPEDRRRIWVTLAAISLATAARAQFAELFVILVVAILAYDWMQSRHRGPAFGTMLRTRYPLWIALAAGVAIFAAITVSGSAGAFIWGRARVRASGMGPLDIIQSAREHFAVLTVLSGIAPVFLGVAGAVSTLARPARRESSALAIVALVTLVVLVPTTASYTIKGLGDLIHERFAFYAVPLLLPLAAQFLERPRMPRAAVAAGLLVSLVGVTAFDAAARHHFSYAAPVDNVIIGRTQQVANATGVSALSADWVLVAVTLAIAALAIAGARRARPALAVAVFGVLVLPFLLASTAYDYNRALHPLANQNIIGLGPHSGSGGGDWVDRALPDGAQAAFVPTPVADIGTSRKLWWDVEFWNKSVTRMYSFDPAWIDSGFPSERVTLDANTGRLTVPHALPYLILPANDRRMSPLGRRIARNGPLELVHVSPPLRTRWITSGLDPDGWTNPGTRAVLRLYPAGGAAPQKMDVTLTVTAPPKAAAPRRLTVVGSLGDRGGSVRPGRADTVRIEACVPASRPRDLQLIADRASPVNGHPAGVALVGVRAVPAGPCPAPPPEGTTGGK